MKFLIFLAAMILAGRIFWLGIAAGELGHALISFYLVLISVWFIWLVKNRR